MRIGNTRIQFSILNVLICTTVLAVVFALCVNVPVEEPLEVSGPLYTFSVPIVESDGKLVYETTGRIQRPPNASEVAARMVKWGLPALGVVIFTLWLERTTRRPTLKNREGWLRG